jgi:hypothetical protein
MKLVGVVNNDNCVLHLGVVRLLPGYNRVPDEQFAPLLTTAQVRQWIDEARIEVVDGDFREADPASVGDHRNMAAEKLEPLMKASRRERIARNATALADEFDSLKARGMAEGVALQRLANLYGLSVDDLRSRLGYSFSYREEGAEVEA